MPRVSCAPPAVPAEIADVLSGSSRFVVLNARVEDVEPLLPDGCASLMPVDGPYHGVKAHDWDNEHDDEEAFLGWKRERYRAWKRILAPNGTLYDFASPRMGARVEVACRETFAVIASVVWNKLAEYPPGDPRGTAWKARDHSTMRSPFPYSERIVMAEQKGSDALALALGESRYGAECDKLRGFVFEPLRAYLDGERIRAKLSADAIRAGMYARTGKRYVFERHSFSRSQWELPTEDQYLAARALFDECGAPSGRPYLARQYEDLRRQCEDLRRPFAVTPEDQYTDVWTYPTVPHRKGKHPCEKPRSMSEAIVRISSRPNDVVLVFFSGSGVFAAEALRLGRRVIAVEMDPHWADVTRAACEKAAAESSPA